MIKVTSEKFTPFQLPYDFSNISKKYNVWLYKYIYQNYMQGLARDVTKWQTPKASGYHGLVCYKILVCMLPDHRTLSLVFDTSTTPSGAKLHYALHSSWLFMPTEKGKSNMYNWQQDLNLPKCQMKEYLSREDNIPINQLYLIRNFNDKSC